MPIDDPDIPLPLPSSGGAYERDGRDLVVIEAPTAELETGQHLGGDPPAEPDPAEPAAPGAPLPDPGAGSGEDADDPLSDDAAPATDPAEPADEPSV